MCTTPWHHLCLCPSVFSTTLWANVPWPTKRTLVDIAGDNCVNTRTINSASMLIHFVKVAFFTRSFLIWLFRPSRIKFPMLMFLSRISIREKTTLMWDQLKGVAQCHLKWSKTLKWFGIKMFWFNCFALPVFFILFISAVFTFQGMPDWENSTL